MTIWIRPMRPGDAPYLPDIEQSAGERFRDIADLAWVADGDNLPEARHLELVAGGACWVAEAEGGKLVAFLSTEQTGDCLHIWELAVAYDRQSQGIGRALMARAIDYAKARRLAAITLSTFRDVPWNDAMYRRMGFSTLAPDELGLRLAAILDREVASGLPPERRCAMRLSLDRAIG